MNDKELLLYVDNNQVFAEKSAMLSLNLLSHNLHKFLK